MNEELWSKVDSYLSQHLIPPDRDLAAALGANALAGLPAIDVTPSQGKLLYLYVKMLGARNILEIGTLGGYSTLWMAKALPVGGKIITLELEPRHAAVARNSLAKAGCADRVEILVGKALDSLVHLRDRQGPRFDLAFIDADKVNALEYFQLALPLCRPGAVIITDNVVRKGHLIDRESKDPNVVGMRRFVEALASEPRVEATAIQTVGSKGHDGFVIARIRE
jgi:predicted O-methyltransferase YrrM